MRRRLGAEFAAERRRGRSARARHVRAAREARFFSRRWPGDVLVVPAAWGHATLNTQPSIGWASEVDHDRGYHDGDDTAFGDQWWRVSNVEGVPEPPSEQNIDGDDEILYGDI